MPGKKGARSPLPKANTVRRKLWQSMRILRRFTVADLLRTIPHDTKGLSHTNAGKFVQRLAAHGYLNKVGDFKGGRPGAFQQYQLVIDNGPEYPVVCFRCGQFITEKVCDAALKETKKDKDKERSAA